MQIEQRDQPLHAAQAAARRLLVRAIDLRFDLDDAADVSETGDSATSLDLQRLRADTEAVRDAIDRLAQLLTPPRPNAGDEEEEVDEGTIAASRL